MVYEKLQLAQHSIHNIATGLAEWDSPGRFGSWLRQIGEQEHAARKLR